MCYLLIVSIVFSEKKDHIVPKDAEISYACCLSSIQQNYQLSQAMLDQNHSLRDLGNLSAKWKECLNKTTSMVRWNKTDGIILQLLSPKRIQFEVV